MTGTRLKTKVLPSLHGYPGGIYRRTFTEMQQQFPDACWKKPSKGMLPKGPLGYAMLAKLKVYASSEHTHRAAAKALEI